MLSWTCPTRGDRGPWVTDQCLAIKIRIFKFFSRIFSGPGGQFSLVVAISMYICMYIWIPDCIHGSSTHVNSEESCQPTRKSSKNKELFWIAYMDWPRVGGVLLVDWCTHQLVIDNGRIFIDNVCQVVDNWLLVIDYGWWLIANSWPVIDGDWWLIDGDLKIMSRELVTSD